MEKQFVTYEIAKQLRELGFDEPVFATFNYEDKPKLREDFIKVSCKLKAPLWQQVIDWFREKHKIRICNLVNIHVEAIFIVYHSANAEIIDSNDFHKSREKAILKAIELLKTV